MLLSQNTAGDDNKCFFEATHMKRIWYLILVPSALLLAPTLSMAANNASQPAGESGEEGPSRPLALSRPARSKLDTPLPPKQTYVYTTAHGCDIRADVYRPVASQGPVPVIVWIHGGALILGSRTDINRFQLTEYLRAGYAVIAIDYRLAPETKLPDIIDDLRSAFTWVRKKGPELFGADPDRVAAVGHSAGGYLTLMSGFAVSPRPKALVSFYGYGDITNDWLRQPSAFYRQQQPLVSRERAFSKLISSPIAESTGNRRPFYLYCRQQGIWTQQVSGHDPAQEAAYFLPFCPVRQVSPDYPPTLLLHGDKDTDVPYSESLAMNEQLSRFEVPHEFITIPDGGHGFDAETNQPAVREAFQAVLRFLKKHL
jgi:acetyl esterase/lipase